MKLESPAFLGIDLGTTNVKALIVAQDGSVISSGSTPVGIDYGPDGSAEQDLEDIWQATISAVRHATRFGKGKHVCAVGVSSQGGALQVLNPDGGLSGKVVGWQDSRGKPWDQEITSVKGQEWCEQHSGYPQSSSAVGQILRLRSQGKITDASEIGWVGDIVVGRLCGRRAHDATSLSEAGLLNPAEGKEDSELLEVVGVDRARLPDLIGADQKAGALLPAVARLCGLPPEIPVGPAIHDQYAAALGAGVVRAGDSMLGAGTAWVLLIVTDRLRPPVAGIALAGRHPVSGLYGQMLSMVNGGSCVDWVAKNFRLKGLDGASVDSLIAGLDFGSNGLRFRPLLSEGGGAGLPASFAGRIEGLRLGHTGEHVLRAMIEGLACELGRYLRLSRESGIETSKLVMCGKAATSTFTPGIIADVTGLPVDCVTSPDTSPLGAAILARHSIEPTVSLVSLANAMKPSVRRVEPGRNRTAAEDLFRDYIESFQTTH